MKKQKKNSLNLYSKLALGVAMSLALPLHALGFEHSHSLWNAILQKHVREQNNGRTTTVDYAALKKNPERLKEYLSILSNVKHSEFKTFTSSDQIAFLVNVYNAFMVSLVVDHYPIKSVKELGIPFVGPWKKSFITVLGGKHSLDDIEHGMLRKNYSESRIHFGVNCASVSCPPLRAEAFVGNRLGQQFDEQAKLFFSNDAENRFDPARKTLRLNPILKWFNGDFSKTGDIGTVLYVSKYLPSLNKVLNDGALKAADVALEYGNYNWDLNGH